MARYVDECEIPFAHLEAMGETTTFVGIFQGNQHTRVS